jgi:hypothetical protein
MKRVFIMMCMSAVVCGSAGAKKKQFYPAIIVQTDGEIMECLAQTPDNFGARVIAVKANRNSKTAKMKSDEIKTVRYFLEDDKIIELDHARVIELRHLYKDRPKYSKPKWLNVRERGYMTLYINTITGNSANSGTYHYCRKEDEDVVSIWPVTAKGFAENASRYFADSPSISEKIKNREKGYHMSDISAIVKEYNAEKLAQ